MSKADTSNTSTAEIPRLPEIIGRLQETRQAYRRACTIDPPSSSFIAAHHAYADALQALCRYDCRSIAEVRMLAAVAEKHLAEERDEIAAVHAAGADEMVQPPAELFDIAQALIRNINALTL